MYGAAWNKKQFAESAVILLCDQACAAVHFPQPGFFDLAGGIPGHLRKDDPVGTLVPGSWLQNSMISASVQG